MEEQYDKIPHCSTNTSMHELINARRGRACVPAVVVVAQSQCVGLWSPGSEFLSSE